MGLVRVYFTYAFILASFTTFKSHAITVQTNDGRDNSSCCTTPSFSCQSLEYALSCIANKTAANPSVILIDGGAGLNGRTNFIIPKGYNVTISSKTDTPTEITCKTSRSMLIIRSNGYASVKFKNIIVSNCGPKVPSSVLIEGPLHAEIDNCTFIDNMCSGLNSRDANLTIKSSKFKNNIANQSDSFDIDFKFGNTSLGGGLGVMFDKAIGNKVQIISSDFSFGSTFVNKDPDAVSHDTGKKRLLSNYYASGGGLSIINTFDSQDNSVLINNCNFEHNAGTYGGGLFLTFVHNSTGNSILVENSSVSKNNVSLTGGGLLISTWDKAHNNKVTLRKCNIFSNNAMGGGAMKVIYNSIDPYNENKGGSFNFEMHDCKIFDNQAMSGSALRLLSNIPAGRVPPLLPKLFNCRISRHRPAKNSKEYPGAVLSTKLGIEFFGSNYLVKNTQGSAIHISSGIIHVKGTLVFYHNMGLQGGAAYLADTSKIVLHPGSYLNISQNHANFRGGGLYVEATTLREVTYPYNPGCFLQYSEAKTPPSKWQVWFFKSTR